MFLKVFSVFSAYVGAQNQTTMEDLEKERAALCALNRIFGYEPGITHRILDALGKASALFEMDRRGREDLMGPFCKHLDEINAHEWERSAQELDALARRGCRFLGITDPDYPALLRECEDAPAGLYIRSDSPPATLFGQRGSVAVVGTRDLSLYGREMCRRIVEAMARTRRGPTIVSGFALGTDIVAHSTALEAGLPTLAVLPTGIDDIYPRRHWKWAERLAATEGCALLTDYPPGTGAIAVNFLRRNRIIAGLATDTILIESKRKGGGLITADFALGYNRGVYALPGRLDDLRSEGCNLLIKRGMAEAIADLDLLMEDLGLGARERRSAALVRDEVRGLYEGTMSPAEVDFLAEVAQCIKKNRGLTPEEIARRLDCGFERAVAAVGILEADGIVETDLLGGCAIKTKIR